MRISPAEAAILFQRYLAFGRVGHARTQAPLTAFVTHLGSGGRFLPLFIRVDGDRVLLTRTADAEGRLRSGMELETLNGEPVAQWIERSGAFVSADEPALLHAQLEQSFPAVLWFMDPAATSISVSATDAGGEVTEIDLPAIALGDLRAIAAAHPTPAPDLGPERSWRMLEGGVAYLRPGPFGETAPADDAPSYQTAGFAAFVDQAFADFLAAGATDLIVDLRDNPGGDNSFSDLIVAWFADRPFRFASSFTLRASPQTKAWYAGHPAAADDAIGTALAEVEAAQPNGARYPFDLPFATPRDGPRFQGRVHVLVNRHSYSNAASMAAMIQDYGFGQVLGEETSDPPSTYASILSFDLPETGVRVEYPKSRIIRPNGDESSRGVIPDHAIPRPPVGEARDLVLEQAAAWVRRAE